MLFLCRILILFTSVITWKMEDFVLKRVPETKNVQKYVPLKKVVSKMPTDFSTQRDARFGRDFCS